MASPEMEKAAYRANGSDLQKIELISDRLNSHLKSRSRSSQHGTAMLAAFRAALLRKASTRSAVIHSPSGRAAKPSMRPNWSLRGILSNWKGGMTP